MSAPHPPPLWAGFGGPVHAPPVLDRERGAGSSAGTPEWIDRVARDDQRLVRVLRLACAALANEKRALQQQLLEAHSDLADARAVAGVLRDELEAAERQISATAAAAASARAGAVGRSTQGYPVASAAGDGHPPAISTRSRSGSSGAAAAGDNDDAMEQIIALNERLHMDIFEQRETFEERLKAAEARRKDEAAAAARAQHALEAEVECLKAALDQAQDAAARGVIEAADTDLARIVASRCAILTSPAVRALDPIPAAEWWAGALATIDALLRPVLATDEPLQLLQQQVDILCQVALAAASAPADRGGSKLARTGVALLRALNVHAFDIATAVVVQSCAASSAVAPSAAGIAAARQQMGALVDPLVAALREWTGDTVASAWEEACATAAKTVGAGTGGTGLQRVFAALRAPATGPFRTSLRKLIDALVNLVRDPALLVSCEPAANEFAPPYGRVGFDMLLAAVVRALRRSAVDDDAPQGQSEARKEVAAGPRVAPSAPSPDGASSMAIPAAALTLLRRAQAHADMLSAQRDMLLAERRDSALRVAAAQEAHQAATARYVAELHDKQDEITALQQQVQVLSDALTQDET